MDVRDRVVSNPDMYKVIEMSRKSNAFPVTLMLLIFPAHEIQEINTQSFPGIVSKKKILLTLLGNVKKRCSLLGYQHNTDVKYEKFR